MSSRLTALSGLTACVFAPLVRNRRRQDTLKVSEACRMSLDQVLKQVLVLINLRVIEFELIHPCDEREIVFFRF